MLKVHCSDKKERYKMINKAFLELSNDEKKVYINNSKKNQKLRKTVSWFVTPRLRIEIKVRESEIGLLMCVEYRLGGIATISFPTTIPCTLCIIASVPEILYSNGRP